MAWVALGAGVISLIYAFGISRLVMRQDPGTEEMKRISDYVHEGAMAFLTREYKTIALFMLGVMVLLIFGLWAQRGLFYAVGTAIAYIVGALLSLSAGYFGMQMSTRSNSRTTAAAGKSFTKALQVAFYGGSVMGMSVVGLGLIGLAALYVIFMAITGDPKLASSILAGFSMGASSVALFARVGGGIYTKAADVGADLTGKVEAGIPEDDPRNPGTIADNVGDNVGDCAGMGADLYESYVGSILSGIVIAAAVGNTAWIALAFLLAAIGIITSLIGVLFIRGAKSNPQGALFRTTLGAALFFGLFSLLAVREITGSFRLYWAVLGGLFAGMVIGYIALYSSTGIRIHRIARASESGVAINILEGISTGMASSVIPLIAIAAAILVAFWSGRFFGIALAGIGMLSITGITVAVDAYGPIADNAGGIAEMSHLPPKIRKITDSLDAAGNTTAAIGKGFAIGSAALTALALFSAFTKQANLLILDILDPRVIAGIFVGAAMPFFFSASVIKAVGRTANKVVLEVRRQFREIKGLLEGTAKADYARCVDITTKGALTEMIIPGIVAFITPVIVGSFFGLDALGGFLTGSLAVGVPLAIFMANSGAAWDNAKKWIEEGNLGGKGSDAHKASVEGDTVGDPFKDTAGPSLNILLKLMAIVSLVFVPFIDLINQALRSLF